MHGKVDTNRPVVKTDSRGRPSYQKFSEWVAAAFPGICTKNEVPDALWLVQDFPVGQEIPGVLSYPCSIRRWFNEQEAAATPDPFDATTGQPDEAPGLSPASPRPMRST
ncbi:hypothetical protein [Pseudorhodoferax sp. Leaf267]|uniref:hypothetical protein n=1 Tax=Pseudorhodoferax sp. Leaf267 TaxID=1736316 RepID=UPI000716127A|nr:hypothetical protein [Pseudorhodoferax sp. Leaf267]KQP22900.1 hypothetical protein ASF43_03135 [Pseudorhodoferax sp. Leaf267]